jgi:hypothetical protein
MAEIYENTPKNQKKFDEFWDSLEEIELPKSCDWMLRDWIKKLDTEFEYEDKFSRDAVREILLSCLRGC